jgi:hypothetical protein
MMRDELVVSLVLGAMVTFICVLLWGRRIVDLIATGA